MLAHAVCAKTVAKSICALPGKHCNVLCRATEQPSYTVHDVHLHRLVQCQLS